MRSLGGSRPQAIFFDLDETLVDNTRPMESLFVEVFETYFPTCVVQGRLDAGVARALKAEVFALWDSVFDHDSEDVIAAMFRSTLLQCQLDASAASAMSRHLVDISANALELRSGAVTILAQLRDAGIATGIITNGLEALQMAKIERVALKDKVDAIVVSEMAGAHKPDAKVFRYALDKLGVRADGAWHVGDHPLNDVTGAMACGMRGILYAPEDAKPERYQLDAKVLTTPDTNVAHLLDIVELLG